MKLVLNNCYGVFSLSLKAQSLLHESDPCKYDIGVSRDDLKLVSIVEALGKEASGKHAELIVVEIPDEATDYIIINYDGLETIYYVLDGKIVKFDAK